MSGVREGDLDEFREIIELGGSHRKTPAPSPNLYPEFRPSPENEMGSEESASICYTPEPRNRMGCLLHFESSNIVCLTNR